MGEWSTCADMTAGKYLIRNKLLRASEESTFDSLRASFTRVEFEAGHRIFQSGEKISDVIFVESGFASTMSSTPDGNEVDIRQTGCEGMIGHHVVLGATSSPYSVVVHISASAISVPTTQLMKAVEHSPNFKKLILRYCHICELETLQFALSNLNNRLNKRLARWLLMCRDRLQTDDLPLTHEFLAAVLGVRRAGITNEIHILEGLHAAKPTRGHLKILDVELLQQIAGSTYGLPEQKHDRLLRDFGEHDREINLS